MADIKPVVSVFDLSDYYAVILLGVLAFALFLALAFFLARLASRANPRKQILRALNELDLSDTKQAAYEISRLAHRLERDKTHEVFISLCAAMDKYKYKKTPPKAFGGQDLALLKTFIERQND